MFKKIFIGILLFNVSFSFFCHQVISCTIAVVSAKASHTGRPFLWKNRDYSMSPREEINYEKGKTTNGIQKRIGNLQVVGETLLYSNVRVVSGGVNDLGFAIINASVIETPERELFNINHILLEKALETCSNLDDFEKFLNDWDNEGIYTVSGNFGVIDAQGGAAMYEIWSDGPGNPLLWEKYDANTSENGYVIRANSHITDGWVTNEGSSIIRYQRACELFQGLFEGDDISPRSVLQEVSKDVGGDCDKYHPGESCLKYGYTTVDPENFNTSNALSRNISTSAYVIDGAVDDTEIPLITLYCALGEPSFTPVVPYFLYSKKTSYYARDEAFDALGYAIDMGIGSFLSEASEKVLLDGLYDTNRDIFGQSDKTLNFDNLHLAQEWIFPIEDFLFDKTEAYLRPLRKNPEKVVSEDLYNFSHECARYAYKNMTQRSNSAYGWDLQEFGTDSSTTGTSGDDGTVSRGCFVGTLLMEIF